MKCVNVMISFEDIQTINDEHSQKYQLLYTVSCKRQNKFQLKHQTIAQMTIDKSKKPSTELAINKLQ